MSDSPKEPASERDMQKSRVRERGFGLLENLCGLLDERIKGRTITERIEVDGEVEEIEVKVEASDADIRATIQFLNNQNIEVGIEELKRKMPNIAKKLPFGDAETA